MFEKVLEKIALALDEGRIRYMIIGGQAVLLHGEPRLTRNIDITLDVTVEKLDVVLKLAKGIGMNSPYSKLQGITSARDTRRSS